MDPPSPSPPNPAPQTFIGEGVEWYSVSTVAADPPGFGTITTMAAPATHTGKQLVWQRRAAWCAQCCCWRVQLGVAAALRQLLSPAWHRSEFRPGLSLQSLSSALPPALSLSPVVRRCAKPNGAGCAHGPGEAAALHLAAGKRTLCPCSAPAVLLLCSCAAPALPALLHTAAPCHPRSALPIPAAGAPQALPALQSLTTWFAA